MAKKKQETAEAPTKAFEIMAASIKDDFCNYTYEIKQGVGAGDTHQVKGKGIVDLGGNFSCFGRIETMKIVPDDKGLLAIWNTVNGRWKQLTNVTFTKN